MEMHEIRAQRQDVDLMPWYISAGDDGVTKDCILVAVMDGAEIRSISLHIAGKPEAGEFEC